MNICINTHKYASQVAWRHLGGTPWHPWACQGVPGWIFDEFWPILGSLFGGLGSPLGSTFGLPSHQVWQSRRKNGVILPSMHRSRHRLAFRTASGGPRTPFQAESALNSGVLARCQYCNFKLKSDPRGHPKWAFGTPLGSLGAPVGSFWRPGGLPKPIQNAFKN